MTKRKKNIAQLFLKRNKHLEPIVNHNLYQLVTTKTQIEKDIQQLTDIVTRLNYKQPVLVGEINTLIGQNYPKPERKFEKKQLDIDYCYFNIRNYFFKIEIDGKISDPKKANAHIVPNEVRLIYTKKLTEIFNLMDAESSHIIAAYGLKTEGFENFVLSCDIYSEQMRDAPIFIPTILANELKKEDSFSSEYNDHISHYKHHKLRSTDQTPIPTITETIENKEYPKIGKLLEQELKEKGKSIITLAKQISEEFGFSENTLKIHMYQMKKGRIYGQGDKVTPRAYPNRLLLIQAICQTLTNPESKLVTAIQEKDSNFQYQ